MRLIDLNYSRRLTMDNRIIRALVTIVVLIAGSELALAEFSDAERQNYLKQGNTHASPLAKQLFTTLGQKGCQGVTKKEWQHLLQKTVSERTRLHILITYSRCLIASLGQTQAQKAVEVLQEALSIKPDNFATLTLLAEAHFLLGEDKEVIEALQRVQTLEGLRTPELYDRLGFSKYRLASRPRMFSRKSERVELLREAEEYLQQAIMLAPWHPNYHNHLSNIFMSQGRYEDAIEKKEEAIALVPDFDEWNEQEKTFALADYHVNLGQIYAFYQRWDEAETMINKGINLAPHGKFRDHLEILGKATLQGKDVFFNPWPLEGEPEHEAKTE